jgi:hypothetical protein
VGSTFFQRVQQIIYHPETLPSILGAALPNSANFFIQFISMRALFLVWLRMCVPHGGVWQNWAHYICCPPAWCSFCNTGEWGELGGAEGGGWAQGWATMSRRPHLLNALTPPTHHRPRP